jgi:hypothetical protein
MNGRVYDPRIGRFVSADPILQAPAFSQSYNRYSYVYANPLSLVDPSGYAAGDDFNLDDLNRPEKYNQPPFLYAWEVVSRLQMQMHEFAYNPIGVDGGGVDESQWQPPAPPAVVEVKQVPERVLVQIDWTTVTRGEGHVHGTILQEFRYGISLPNLRDAHVQTGKRVVMMVGIGGAGAGVVVAAPHVAAAAPVAGTTIATVWVRIPQQAKDAIWELGGSLLSGYTGQPSSTGIPNPDVDAPPQGTRTEQVDKPHRPHRLPKGLRFPSP